MPIAGMKPMFLPGVEENPQPSPYRELIRNAQDSGREYSQIWHLFAFDPDANTHLARFTQAVMRDPSPLSPALRELIAAYVSSLNKCDFCMKSHAAVAAELLGGDQIVKHVLHDVESSPIEEKEKVLLRFVKKITIHLPDIRQDDVERVRDSGWTDAAIYYAITTCALFNFYNRWVSATGVHAVSDESHRSRAKLVAREGYVRK